ncbi:MAG: M20/M25/M40 family metallo-hydrolase, partial [Chloroflexi bacterium]
MPSPAVTEAAQSLLAEPSLRSIQAEISKRHDESVGRLQEWVRHPALAAEDRGMDEGCDLMMRLARDAGFQKATRIDTDGHPGVFATLDAGAAKTVALYFMYDVKQADPAEWSSPPFTAAIVDRPGFGKVIIGRGAVNQKGPQAAFLAALHAIQGAGKKLPVNLVLVAEGEEEIGSPHFRQVVADPDVRAALRRTIGVFMPSAFQDPDGSVSIFLGAKGVVECELVASGEKWGRGPTKDVHSSNRARLDSPAFHLVQALSTLVTADGDPAIDGFGREAKAATAAERAMLDAAATKLSEATAKSLLGSKRWAGDLPWRATLERFLFTPTVNIEGLVAGYTGPGGKTVMPHRAVAKLDLRLVPDMTYEGAIAALKAHLAKRGFADIDVNPSGGYDPTSTSSDAPIIQAMLAVLKREGIDPVLLPRLAGSYPG